MPTLNWIGKEAVVNHHHAVPFRLLRDVPELSVGDPGSGNLIVQGDNLVALKALLPYYAGQVKCIYIDPPYNTGNEGWIYNDNVNSPLIRDWLGKAVGKEAEDLSRHDKWLCLMYPRLALLRQFLRDDGAIFISLDDNEIASLRFLMDEIFGAQNFVATVIWQKKYSTKADSKHLSESHDYIAIYAKRKDRLELLGLPRTEKQLSIYKNPDNDARGAWTSDNLLRTEARDYAIYPLRNPKTKVEFLPPKGSSWRFNDDKMIELIADNRIWFGVDGTARPRLKRFLSEVRDTVTLQTFWGFGEVGHNDEAKKETMNLFADDIFATPKPTRLIERILQIASNPGDLILDSFAGSGTTGHAVLNLNKADGGNRKFILVEMEPKIARDITAERVKRVAQGYTNAKGEKVEGLGGGFRFCELGEPLFDEHGQIKSSVRFADLARHVYFTETGEPLPRERVLKSPLLGECRGVGIYLLFNGILGDKSANGGNILTRAVLAQLPKFDGQKVIYCAGCLLGKDRLQAERIIVRQTPYEIKVA
jgi:site-specific DNA-methyltransferase (adenine-specific)/adenine-specific DNA-methyltransferase